MVIQEFDYWYKGIVIGVYDADTVTINVDLGFSIEMKAQKFRLYGINAPELRGDEREAGLLARDWLSSQIYDREVLINSYRDKVGKYGRWLARIYNDTRTVCFNDELVQLGFAKYAEY